jgi:predicted nucleotidyltransferase
LGDGPANTRKLARSPNRKRLSFVDGQRLYFRQGANTAGPERPNGKIPVMATALDIDRDALAEFCRANGIRRLSLFGSVLHGTNRPDSDLDLLVEFEPDSPLGLLGLAQLEIDLSDMLGVSVDLRTPAELSRYFRDEVQAQAEVLYAAA